jgi:NifU-like protein involved in Fe-S cluster formation
MLIVLSFARVRDLARAVNSALWEVVYKGRGCASMMAESDMIMYQALRCPS